MAEKEMQAAERGMGSLERSSRSIGTVEAGKLHASTVLPTKDVDPNQVKAIKEEGVQQPFIVRPSPVERGMYEIIDGHVRYRSVEKNQQVVVDLRKNVDDSEVFRISEATFRRNARTTFERAMFYCSWAKTLQAGCEGRGVQVKLAGITRLSEAEISNYISIGKLFERLAEPNVSKYIFNALKTQSINKLCELAKTRADSVMLDAAQKMVKEPNMPLQELKSWIIELEYESDKLTMLEEDDDKRQAAEESKMNKLSRNSQDLEKAMDETNKAVFFLKENLANNPCAYSSWTIVHKLGKILNALKRIRQQATSVIDSAKEGSA